MKPRDVSCHLTKILTKKNHYNPCFWTAYWNFQYLLEKRKNKYFSQSVRDTVIYCLNLRSNKILHSKTEKVFYEKHAGLAKVSPEMARVFVKKNYPEDYENFHALEREEITIDFENIFTKMEEGYKGILEKLIIDNKKFIFNDESKTLFSMFILCQILRNPKSLNPMQNYLKKFGMEKFEVLLQIRNNLVEKNTLRTLLNPFLYSKWTTYILNKNIFPLSDTPILIKNHNIMIAVAPNIMIEMTINLRSNKVGNCITKNKISCLQYNRFLRRTILNADREIIFGDQKLLEKIQQKSDYKNRILKINGS